MTDLNESCISSVTDTYDDTDQLVVNIVGWLAVACTITRCLAPIPSVINIYREKSTQEYSAVPFIAQLANALIWLIYFSVSTRSIPAIFSRIVAIVLALGYLIVFGMFISNRKKRKFYIIIFLCMSGSLGSGLFIYMLHEIIGGGCWHLQILGINANITSTCVYMGPLASAKSVWRTKETRFMPWQMVGAGFAGSVLWLVYGVLVHDLYLTIVSAMGAVITSSQVYILLYTYFRYSRHSQKILSDQEEPDMLPLEIFSERQSVNSSDNSDVSDNSKVKEREKMLDISKREQSDALTPVKVVSPKLGTSLNGTMTSMEEI